MIRYFKKSTGGSGGAVNSVNGKTGDVVLTTADIADSADKRYCTDAEKTVIGMIQYVNVGGIETVQILFPGDPTPVILAERAV